MVLGEAAPRPTAGSPTPPRRCARPARRRRSHAPSRSTPAPTTSAGRVLPVQRRPRRPPAPSGSPTNSPRTSRRRDSARRGVPVVLGDRHERRSARAAASRCGRRGRWRRARPRREPARRSTSRTACGSSVACSENRNGSPVGSSPGSAGPAVITSGVALRIAVKMLPSAWPTPTAECRLTNAALRARLRVAVGHRDRRRLLQRQHVAEVGGRVLEEAQLGRARVAEDRRHAERAQQRVGRLDRTVVAHSPALAVGVPVALEVVDERRAVEAVRLLARVVAM